MIVFDSITIIIYLDLIIIINFNLLTETYFNQLVFH